MLLNVKSAATSSVINVFRVTLVRFADYVWGAVRKNIIPDRFSTKTAISAHI